MINCVTGERGAQRGADTDRAADDAETEIEPPRASRDICDHEWNGNAENCGADATDQNCVNRLPTTNPSNPDDGFAGRLVWPLPKK